MHYGGPNGLLTLEIAQFCRRNNDYQKFGEYLSMHSRLTASSLDMELSFDWFQWLLVTNSNADPDDDDEAIRSASKDSRDFLKRE